MLNTLSGIFNIKDLRNKFLFTLAVIIIFRLGVHLPIPGVDSVKLTHMFGAGNLLNFLDLFTGGAFVKFSIFAMGIVPYINASIIFQLLTAIIPQLEELAKEGDSGRKQIAQYTRYLTIVLAAFQAFGMAFWLRSVLLPGYSFTFFLVSCMILLTAGSALVMWMGELITERGIGNGASLIIFIGIVSRIPTYIGQTILLLKGGASFIGVSILLAVFILMKIGRAHV